MSAYISIQKMMILLLLLQGTRSSAQDFGEFRSELERIIAASKTSKESFMGSNYTAFQFKGVKPEHEYDLISTCSNACSSTGPDDNLSIIQVRKRKPCVKTEKEQMSDMILCLYKCLSENDRQEVFTADHQISVHNIAFGIMNEFMIINNRVHKKMQNENILHSLFLCNIKKAIDESLEHLYLEFYDEAVTTILNQVSKSPQSPTKIARKDSSADLNSAYVTIFEKFKAGKTLLKWFDKFKKIHDSYNCSFDQAKIDKLYDIYIIDSKFVVDVDILLKNYTSLHSVKAFGFINRNILPALLQKTIEIIDEGGVMAFNEWFYRILEKTIESYKTLPNSTNQPIRNILEENRNSTLQSIRQYFATIGLTQYLDSLKHMNFNQKGYIISPIHVSNTIKIVCNGIVNIESCSQLSYILRNINNVFDDDKPQLIYIDMQQKIDTETFFYKFYIPRIKFLNSPTNYGQKSKGLADTIIMVTKDANSYVANHCDLIQKFIKCKLSSSEEANSCFSVRWYSDEVFENPNRDHVLLGFIQVMIVCDALINSLATPDAADNTDQSTNILQISLSNDSKSYEIMIKHNHSMDGKSNSLCISHNLPFPTANDSYNQLNGFDELNGRVIYDNDTIQIVLSTLVAYLKILMQIPELIEFPLLHYDRSNEKFLDKVQILSNECIITYNECFPFILNDVNQKLFAPKNTTKRAYIPLLILTYKDVLERHLNENAWNQKTESFTLFHSIDIQIFGQVLEKLIMDEKHLNITNNYGFEHYSCDLRQMYVRANVASDSKTYITILRDHVENEMNYLTPYHFVDINNESLENFYLTSVIPMVKNGLGLRLTISPLTLILISLLEIRLKVFGNMEEQFDANRNEFDRVFCKLINKYRRYENIKERTVMGLREDTFGYEVLTEYTKKILSFIRTSKTLTNKSLKTKMIRASLDKIHALGCATANEAAMTEQE